MVAEILGTADQVRPVRRILAWSLGGFAVAAAVGIGVCFWVTEPLEPEDLAALDELNHPVVAKASLATKSKPEASAKVTGPVWPLEKLEGDEAKRLMLELLLPVEAKLDRMTGYTATFRKQERIGTTLRPEETLAIKIRHRPFAFYGKFLAPRPGKEVVYAEGHHENKVIATGGGLTRLLVPRLALDPSSPVALADSRHPVTDAGLAHLVHRLVRFRKLDLTDAEATTSLDHWTDPSGRRWFRSTHLHSHRNADRPFAKVEVLYDTASLMPLRISNFDWSAADALDVVGPLAEKYGYDDVQIDVPLSALDFDPANPNYAFHRF